MGDTNFLLRSRKASSHTNHDTTVTTCGVPVQCVWGKNIKFEDRAVCRAGFFGGCSERGRAKNLLGCTYHRSMLGKSKTAVDELRKFRDTSTVDQILIEGDRMYFNALQNQNIPDTERRSLNYLPNQARWNFQSPFEVTKSFVEENTIAL